MEGTPIFLCAHLDTVPPDGPLEPVVEDGVVRNAGGTILGADNKSAVVAMLEAARRVLAEGRPHAGIELIFTMKEEIGLHGAAAFDHDRLHAQIGYVYDQAAPIGEIILGAPWSQSMEVRFHGRAAHSGMFPEGRALRDPGCSEGDRRSPARPRRRGDDRERRRHLRRDGREHRPRVVHIQCRSALPGRAQAAGHRPGDARRIHVCGDRGGVRGRDRADKSYNGYRFKRDTDAVKLAAAALEACGYTPTYALSGGGADANVFNDRGRRCVNLANGMTDIHTPDERIAVADLDAMVDVTLALVDAAR